VILAATLAYYGLDSDLAGGLLSLMLFATAFGAGLSAISWVSSRRRKL
jgi:hypothetical protein